MTAAYFYADDSAFPDLGRAVPDFQSDTAVQGAGDNTLPVVSAPQQTSIDSPWQGIGNVMGTIGSTYKTARDLGTAAGTIKRDFESIKPAFDTAYKNAATGNSAGTWWQYASPTDKAMIALAVIGIVIAIGK